MHGQAPKKNRWSKFFVAPAIGNCSTNSSTTECRTSLYLEGNRHPKRIDDNDARADGVIEAQDLVRDKWLHIWKAVFSRKRPSEKNKSSISSRPALRQTSQWSSKY